MQVIADGRNSNTAGTAIGYATTIIEAFNAQWRADHASGKSGRASHHAGLVQSQSRNPLAT